MYQHKVYIKRNLNGFKLDGTVLINTKSGNKYIPIKETGSLLDTSLNYVIQFEGGFLFLISTETK